ncbi:MAG TPA: TonB-dependent receptor [Candidatus Polarisedimenticolaceae bacterium]|nr:TonB-dependent receptor [Candidatus Polarisedimenticolaceae bacterium]
MRHGILLGLLAAALGATVAAEPESPPPPPPTPELTEYVQVGAEAPASSTIATKVPVPLQQIPANVGVVGEELLREQSARTLGDALRNVSGLNVQSQSGVTDFFLIRGFDSLSSGLVLSDGAGEPEVTLYPVYNLEGVEVLKGPGGFLYGSNPLSGAVNLVRKQPLPGNFGSINAAYGSFATLDAAVDWNLGNDTGSRAFRLNATSQETNGYRHDTDGKLRAINPAFTWRPSDATALHFNLEYVNAKLSPDNGLPLVGTELPAVDRDNNYQSPFDRSDQDIVRFQFDYEHTLTPSLKLRDKAYQRSLDWVSNGTFFNGVFPDQNGRLAVSRTLLLLDDAQRWTGNQLESVLTFGSAVKHTLLAGVELARQDDEFTLDIVPPESQLAPGLPPIDLLQPVETATTITPFPFLGGDARSRIVAPYVVDQIDVSSRFHVQAGVRYDFIDFSDRVNEIDRDDSGFSPRAGLAWTPREASTLYVDAGRSFAPPSPRVISEDREPERGDQFELGWKQQFLEGKLRTTVAAYQLERDNMAIPDDNGVTQQQGDQRSRGIELELAAEPLPRLHTFLAYALTDAELTHFAEQIVVGVDQNGQPVMATVDRSGNTPAFAPRHLLNLWVGKSFASGLGVGGGARWVSAQFIAEDNAARIDSYVLLDATVYYDLRNCRMKVTLKNLADKEYETRGFGATSVLPGQPFSANFGFEYRF